MNYSIKLVDRYEICPGDIIQCKDGILRTVCQKDIRHDSFMGTSIFGDTYRLGLEKVKRVENLIF